ncbi:MAG: hypothetical protein ABJ387_03565 [Balneola sp.]
MEGQAKVNQLGFELNARKIEKRPDPPKEDPDSTLVQDTLVPVLRNQLSAAEYSRIESSVKRLDWNIDLILRDREIKAAIRKLVKDGMKVAVAVEEIAREFYLDDQTVYGILYEKREKKN